jgi:broad specificity phosphatase PhoE
MGSLVLVRHGPSAYAHRGLLDRAGVHRWRADYDASGIRPNAHPPAALVTLAAGAMHIVSSDLPRALESAARLAPQRAITVSALIREAPLAVPPWPTRLPLTVWDSLMTARWCYQRLCGADTRGADWCRAEEAARWLVSLVRDGATAVVVTHGVFRQLVGRRLIELGWLPAQRQGGYRHWSAWRFAPSGSVGPRTFGSAA